MAKKGRKQTVRKTVRVVRQYCACTSAVRQPPVVAYHRGHCQRWCTPVNEEKYVCIIIRSTERTCPASDTLSAYNAPSQPTFCNDKSNPNGEMVSCHIGIGLLFSRSCFERHDGRNRKRHEIRSSRRHSFQCSNKTYLGKYKEKMVTMMKTATENAGHKASLACLGVGTKS